MSNSLQSGAHSAEASALGFYYQALFAFLVLFQQTTDKAAVSVEQLDDVQLTTEGEELLYQLKHSFLETPTPIGLKSRAFWKTIKVWIDILDEISAPETTLHLITVAQLFRAIRSSSYFKSRPILLPLSARWLRKHKGSTATASLPRAKMRNYLMPIELLVARPSSVSVKA
jgi:hypothetical protein